MGLNGISVWQWFVIGVIFLLAIIAAPAIARSRRAARGKGGGAEQQGEDGPQGD
jgi:hypothetical protein